MLLHVEHTPLADLLLLEPKRFGDHRGFFAETWNKDRFAEAGVTCDFVQDNHSLSTQVGTIRGLHYQAPPHGQAKLVRCGQGRIFDVAVDVRKGSPSYGQWFGAELSFENGKQLFIPEGFLHGFMTLETNCEIVYKCSAYYAPEADGSVHWASCGIDWPTPVAQPLLSEKDSQAISMDVFDSPFTYEAT